MSFSEEHLNFRIRCLNAISAELMNRGQYTGFYPTSKASTKGVDPSDTEAMNPVLDMLWIGFQKPALGLDSQLHTSVLRYDTHTDEECDESEEGQETWVIETSLLADIADEITDTTKWVTEPTTN
jgi:hypothetical protein